MHKEPLAIMWFRRDLRLSDNAALYHALKSGLPVLPIFIFDRNILDDLEEKADARVSFIHRALSDMQDQLLAMGSTMDVRYGTPAQVFNDLLQQYPIQAVFTNHDYEQYALDRDAEIETLLKEAGASFHHYKDQVIFEKNEVIKDDGRPYTVFTPYSKRWKATVNEFYLRSYPTHEYAAAFYKQKPIALHLLESMGFQPVNIDFPTTEVNETLVRKYTEQRNFPGIRSTSRLGIHLRFGTISIRELARKVQPLNETFFNELIWRDFYHMILHHFPHVSRGRAFRAEYDLIEWRNNEKEFAHWCNGTTGYPIVDAGMRELNATGFMHNRVRMIVASFLTKHLLIDWRWGEAYFAKKLLDYDFAANNGGWQWAAGSGCDAAPYFRIFNPYLQTEKFDPKGVYIRKWISEFDSLEYPSPIVDHDVARKRCLQFYSAALKPDGQAPE